MRGRPGSGRRISMSDETEEYIESVSIPTLVWLGEPGSGRREMASAFVKARFSTMALDGTIAEKPEWNPVLPDGDGAESLQKGLRKDHYARICLFDAPKGEEADALMRGAYDKPLSKALRGAHVLVWFVSCPRLPDPGMLGLLRTMRAICPDVPLLIAADGIENAGEDYRADGFDIDDGQSYAEETARNWLARLREEFTPYSPKDVIPCAAPKGDQAAWNLSALSDAIMKALPPSARLEWQFCTSVTKDRGSMADNYILGATAAAAGIGVVPLPVADMPFIIGTQVTLLIALFRLYGRQLDSSAARSLTLAAASAVVGPLAFSSLSKLVPGLGSVFAGSVAAACTWAVGHVAKNVLEQGGEFDIDDFKSSVRKMYTQYVKDREPEKLR